MSEEEEERRSTGRGITGFEKFHRTVLAHVAQSRDLPEGVRVVLTCARNPPDVDVLKRNLYHGSGATRQRRVSRKSVVSSKAPWDNLQAVP